MAETYVAPNGNAIRFLPRCGSHSIASACLREFHPDLYAQWQQDSTTHPAQFLPSPPAGDYPTAIVVRDPLERLRSFCAHRKSTPDEQIAKPAYRQYPAASAFTRVFKMEAGLGGIAAWLGLSGNVENLDESPLETKPVLTPKQRASARAKFSADQAIWEGAT